MTLRLLPPLETARDSLRQAEVSVRREKNELALPDYVAALRECTSSVTTILAKLAASLHTKNPEMAAELAAIGRRMKPVTTALNEAVPHAADVSRSERAARAAAKSAEA
ncbi:hypothetical protein [Amycolatopsis sp. PS_44_ISF1]|uniref:hypothetical protein n=1 Tax=Amycolatopsis sp. PS_44_ISF1 TaxID=2974917 RepID=UPI0028E00123|nr:hypothetical protein [Amycolatopsis sp. PS_44_ISF1]MDT8916227.1 hypothetical protein [Amycolatopsis sp. PS_44_ISF1]